MPATNQKVVIGENTCTVGQKDEVFKATRDRLFRDRRNKRIEDVIRKHAQK